MLSQKDKEQILHLKSQEWTWKSISEAVKATPAACRKFFQRHQATADLPPKLRLPKTMIQGSLALKIKRMVNEKPSISYRDIEHELKKHAPGDEHVPRWSTIRTFLLSSGYKMVKLIKNPLLSDINWQKRIIFAEKMLENPAEFWERVIWSDETTVRSNPNSKEVFFKVHNSVKRENLPFNTKSQSQGISVMFWGCFSKQGLGPLVVIDGTLNAENYKNLLEEYLLPEIRSCNVPMTFMQDNAPCHKAKPVLEFFKSNGITTLDWPPQSPDLNPIENLWSIIKRKRAKKFGIPTSKKELIEQIFEIWDNIDIELQKNLANSVSNRLNEVLKKNGRQINY